MWEVGGGRCEVGGRQRGFFQADKARASESRRLRERRTAHLSDLSSVSDPVTRELRNGETITPPQPWWRVRPWCPS